MLRIFTAMVVLVCATLPVAAADSVQSKRQSIANGKAVFMRSGCYGCHGTAGQGGTGPKLGPDPMPLDALSAFVRGTVSAMPPYSEKILSDSELADIHAYLASVPKPPDVKSISILND